MAGTSEDTIMEEREELMVSPKLAKHHHPTRKVARFLKPSVSSIDVQPFPFNLPTASSVPEKSSLNVSFNGWRTTGIGNHGLIACIVCTNLPGKKQE
ncbi:unnamed protein product [Lactuca virosa]|uniref:Uncharacterized protein n=1 Tax=Lactuca virosa TaxID=75947 RepID=A0AAU9PJD0_9ASTR|nr:unnamed protein product [Lactuca virosa]